MLLSLLCIGITDVHLHTWQHSYVNVYVKTFSLLREISNAAVTVTVVEEAGDKRLTMQTASQEHV